MDDKELEARKLCAWCNFSKDCEECSHRDWPSGRWLLSQQFQIENCKEWKYYISEQRTPLLIRIKRVLYNIWFWLKRKFKKSDIRIWQVIYGKCSW